MKIPVAVTSAILLLKAVAAQQTAYGQCGGIDWTGATTCVSGYTCTYSNDWYSQCVPGTPATTTTTTSSSRTSSTATTSSSSLVTSTSQTSSILSSTSSSRSSSSSSTTKSSSTSTASASEASIFVSSSGSNSGTGSITSPLLSIQSAVNLATPGTTIYLRGGTYALSTNIQINKNGTAKAPITLRNYPGENVILDGESMAYTPADLGASLPNSNRGVIHIQVGEYWRFINLEIINGPYGIYQRDSSNNYYEGLKTHDNYESGFHIEGIAANNTVLWLDSYRNRDPRKNGESADGLALKQGSGTGNLIRGARLWDNVDDGLDLIEFRSPVTILDTIVWGNDVNRWGFSDFQGDGNGFKLGGGAVENMLPVNHKITNCIAFSNAADGFTDNHNPGVFAFTRNTAWNNGDRGFQADVSNSVYTQNIAALNKGPSQILLSSTHTENGNSWNVGGTWNNATFLSVDANLVKGARQADGRIVASNFLKPASGAAIGATTTWS